MAGLNPSADQTYRSPLLTQLDPPVQRPQFAPQAVPDLPPEEDNPEGGFDEEDLAPLDPEFAENMADIIGLDDLARLGADIVDGVTMDEMSRTEAIATYNEGKDILATKLEPPKTTPSNAQVSSVRHPILLKAVIKFQSKARGEMLPAAGPAKVQQDDSDGSASDELAKAFQTDINHFLTKVAKEYYPDFDRGLFMLGYSGNLFRKAYHCPLRRRPAVDSIDMPDLIVDNGAADLSTAIRVTHRSYQSPEIVKRMQISGAWLDIALGEPAPAMDPSRLKQKQQEGLIAYSTRPGEQYREVLECHTSLVPADWGMGEFSWEGEAAEGLPLPYKVTVDRTSKKVLEVRRNWKEHDTEYQKRNAFVHYGLLPGFGLLCLGYLHLVGNSARALTAIWRLMIDAGMFANFPGGYRVKGVTRTESNIFQPGPGEFPEIDIGPMKDIRAAFLPMPYKGVDQAFIAFAELIDKTVDEMAGMVELEVGEGRANVPVGTIMAMLEEKTEIMAAVHKRLHTAQAEELQLIRELFAEDPSALSRLARKPARQWQVADEFMNLDLVPVSDPNIPAQVHRTMLATALVQVADANKDLYDRRKAHKRAWESVNMANIDEVFIPEQQAQAQAQAPDPKLEAAKAQIAAKAEGDKVSQQGELQLEQIRHANRMQELSVESADRAADRASREKVADIKEATERADLVHKMNVDVHDRTAPPFPESPAGAAP